MNTLIISGGNINYDFALDFIKQISFDAVIAVDKGMQFAYDAGVNVSYIVGDFDSVPGEILAHYRQLKGIRIDTYEKEKDATDTRIAVEQAIAAGSSQIWLLGATGGRLDHCLGNISCLALAQKQGVCAWIVDEYNCIRIIESGTVLEKTKQFGKYVSFLPFGGAVTGVCLEGFKYPLIDYTLVSEDGIGISNEIAADQARVRFTGGWLLMIQSRD